MKNVWGYFSVGAEGGLHEYADSQFGHCFLEKNTLGTRDSSSAVSGFCQVFIGFFSRGLGLRTPEYPATAEKKPLVPGVSEKSLYLSRY